MISLVFRIALIVCSILTTVFMIKKIRNSKLQIEHAIFWLMFAFLLIVISLFPQLTIWGAKLLGIYSFGNSLYCHYKIVYGNNRNFKFGIPY